jgi:transcriptional regulator with XRE-family HTH domain
MINSETLKALRGRLNLTQEGLAEQSKVSQKTIWKIENGESPGNSNTTNLLASFFKITPEELAGPFSEIKSRIAGNDRDEYESLLGYRRLNELVSGDTLLSFEIVELLYGISRSQQIKMASLFTALLAEASLKWRNDKASAVENAASSVREMAEGHLSFALAIIDVEEGLFDERNSIQERDIFGAKLNKSQDRFPFDPEKTNPFIEYLRDFTQNLDTEHIAVFSAEDSWIGSDGLPDHEIGKKILDKITGNNKWARIALSEGIIDIRKIPKELMNKENADKRATWLADQVSAEKRAEIEARHNDLLNSF